MPSKAAINALINRATVEREALDGETILIGTPGTLTGASTYTGIFATIEDPFIMDETGTSGREHLSATVRIDQFLDDPTSFDPAGNYRSQQPVNQSLATLRGRTWRLKDVRRSHDSFLFKLIEARPRG